MTQESLSAFIDRVKLDPAIQEELKLASDIEAIVKIAATAGFELTADDLMSLPTGGNNELDDAQLENIAGGMFAWTPNGLPINLGIEQTQLPNIQAAHAAEFIGGTGKISTK